MSYSFWEYVHTYACTEGTKKFYCNSKAVVSVIPSEEEEPVSTGELISVSVRSHGLSMW